MDDIENEQKDEKEQKLVTSRSMIPTPTSLNRPLATSSAIQHILAENDQVFKRFSSIIAAQAKLADFGNLSRLPIAFQEMNAVSKSIERLLSLETSQIKGYLKTRLTNQKYGKSNNS